MSGSAKKFNKFLFEDFSSVDYFGIWKINFKNLIRLELVRFSLDIQAKNKIGIISKQIQMDNFIFIKTQHGIFESKTKRSLQRQKR